MYATQHHRLEHELVKWLVLLFLAGSIVLLATRRTSAEHAPPRAPVYKGHMEPRLQNADARSLWRVLETHRTGHPELAIVHWQLMAVERDTEVWKTVAIGASRLRLGQLDAAIAVLSNHECEANAVVHHLLAVAEHMKAAAEKKEGALCTSFACLAKSADHFEEAISTAKSVRMNQRLGAEVGQFVAMQRYDAIFPERLLRRPMPTVRDLLVALDLEDFEAKSHLGLAEIQASQGALRLAEENIDAAARLDADAAAVYLNLAKAYEDAGDQEAATRAYLKAFGRGKKSARTLLQAMRTFRQTW